MAELLRPHLSAENPWPGLSAFSETDEQYFHGRDVEAAELVRLIRREPLTILFGRSGLGKTSLLAAGVFPLLRPENFLPIYIRLSFMAATPLAQQCQDEAVKGCAAWYIEAPPALPGATLWEFFQRSDAKFWSARNRPVTPVLVLDQFEEIFTLGGENEAAQQRCKTFLEELADVVENRPPPRVKQVIEADPEAATSFDFERRACKIVLSFREDFLAEVEGLRRLMPSLMRNRYRLQAMNGGQAREVVMKSNLVDEDIAGRIIGLAWRNAAEPPPDPADFPHLEIDPALLSVICAELNNKRVSAKPPLDRITRPLLSGAEREILADFYERSFANLDSRARAFVEDELITDRGYRDSYALEDAVARAGVSQQAINQLIARRLLRVDERLGVRRLELTHDVLTRVVRESRDNRRAREAEQAVKAREQAALVQQRRNKRNAALILGAGLIVLVLAVMTAWFSLQAKRLLREAEVAHLMAAADTLQDIAYDSSLLVNLQAIRMSPTLYVQAGLLRRFRSHPQLSAFLFGHEDEVFAVAFSPDGKRLASASRDKTVIVWDLDTRKAIATLEGHKAAVFGVAFSPDGKRVASASDDKTVIVWDLEKRKPLATLEGHKEGVYGVAFSPDGKRLASASYDHTAIVWDLDTRKPLGSLEGHTKALWALAFSPDGKRVASASDDKTVIVWDLEKRKPLATLEGHKEGVYGVAFSPDGKRLASAGYDHTVIVWDLDTRKALATLEGHKAAVFAVAFSPDAKYLASASADKTVVIWDLDTRKALATLEGHKRPVFGIAFSPDAKYLASASWDKMVILWDLDQRKQLSPLEGHKGPVWGIAFSPDGKRLASGSYDHNVILWDLRARVPLTMLEGHKDRVWAVAFSPDGKQVASASGDKTVIVWDLDTRKALATLEGHNDAVYGVAFSPDGKGLASASWDETIIVWDLDTRKPVATLKGHKDRVYGVAFSPDGKRLASASRDKTVIVWDLNARMPLAVLQGHKEGVYGVAFSPDGKRLASASDDWTVIVWDLKTSKPLATLEGHKAAVYGVAFSPDGKRLASAGYDHTVIVSDLVAGKQLARLEGHKGAVWGVAFSPDGKYLASTSEDKTVILWELDATSLADEACRTANRNLTCGEWREYVGVGMQYKKVCDALPQPDRCE